MDDDDDQHIDPRLWDSVYTPPPPPTNHPAGNNPPVTDAPVAAAPVADTPVDLAGTPPPPSPSVTQAAPRGKPAKKSSGDRWTAVEIQALREGNADANWKYRRMINEDPRLLNRSIAACESKMASIKRKMKKLEERNRSCNPDNRLDGNNHGPKPPPGPDGPPFGGGGGGGGGGMGQASMVQVSGQHS